MIIYYDPISNPRNEVSATSKSDNDITGYRIVSLPFLPDLFMMQATPILDGPLSSWDWTYPRTGVES